MLKYNKKTKEHFMKSTLIVVVCVCAFSHFHDIVQNELFH